MHANVNSKEVENAQSLESAVRANLIWGAVGVCASLCANVLLVRCLSATLFAEYAVSTAIIAVAVVIMEAGGASALSRYLQEAEQHQARETFYGAFQRRRLLFGIAGVMAAALVGPFYGGATELPGLQQGLLNWLLLGSVATIQLTGQLAYVGLQTLFEHKRILRLKAGASIVRAILIVCVSVAAPSLTAVLFALLVVSGMESAAYHRLLSSKISGENSPLPPGFMKNSIRFGGITIIDKLIVSLGLPNVLFLYWATTYGAGEIALLGVAVEAVQRLISLAGLPLSGVLVPYLNRAIEGMDLRKKAGNALFATGTVYAMLLTIAVPLMPMLIAVFYGASRLGACSPAQWLLLSAAADSFGRGPAAYLLRAREYSLVLAADIVVVALLWSAALAVNSVSSTTSIAIYAGTRTICHIIWVIGLRKHYDNLVVRRATVLFGVGVFASLAGILLTGTLTGFLMHLASGIVVVCASLALLALLLANPIFRTLTQRTGSAAH